MTGPQSQEHIKRVLIASANPLFARGLQKLFLERWGNQAEVVGITRTMDETLAALETLQPDMVIVDYDDKTINRESFMRHYVAGVRSMQVMLVSLQESGAVVVYDRKNLTFSQAEDWLTAPFEATSKAEEEIPQPKRSNVMKHFFIIGVLVIILTILVNFILTSVGLMPVEASTQATLVDSLMNTHVFLISFLFSLIVVFVVYSLIVFRRRKTDSDEDEGRHITGNNRLELVWTIVPLALVLYISFLGSRSLAEVRRVDPQAMTVNVIGGQWYWAFEYPEYGITTQSLNLPVNKQVLLKMSSRDVIHSFWVPEFRVKQDLLPGENLVKELRVTPSLIGNYKVLCAELCGGAHAYMTAPVIVQSEQDFNAWIEQQSAAANIDPAARGKLLATNTGCISCHSLDGSQTVGPTWKGLYNHPVTLADGSTVTADETYLKNSIVNPPAQVVQGFTGNIMPTTYDENLTDQQIADIIEFIKTVE